MLITFAARMTGNFGNIHKREFNWKENIPVEITAEVVYDEHGDMVIHVKDWKEKDATSTERV